ncbi:VanZ family protein [Flavobacterium sp. W22_SRS_FP1]|uniref:VanZ family protein n=1 Tax=Flavobacterium sp. W22_SRS_FP1 TaxID=3240276 RepID=UPI003F8FB691
MLKQLFFWAALLWTGIVFTLSLVQSNSLPVINIVNLDKYVHAFFHYVFTSLWFLFLISHSQNKRIFVPLMIAFTLSVFFGIAIEVLQGLYTTTRREDILDVAANVFGATLAIFTIVMYYRIRRVDNN